ncbi:MAG TPA: glycosyltransferase family 2 protein [Candidatus Hydrogenedentes bacterium]|nr:glycosyltransferase family 2 protein [Candidatus Hydrogenedentota bacterium]
MTAANRPPTSGSTGPGKGPAKELTVLVPVFNEEDNIGFLYERLISTLDAYGKSFELLFIEDGSVDRSFEKLAALHHADARVRVVRFARNFGQQMAISAGLQYGRGEVIVLIDADLQAPPEEIPRLVDKLAEGYDIVYGVRKGRIDSLLRRVGSWGMSHLLYRITGIDIPDSASGFTALDRRFVENINLYSDKSKYFSGLFAWLSYGRWATVDIRHTARHSGESKYTIAKLVSLTLNFVCNFTVMPLRFSLFVGAVLAGASLATAAGWAFAGALGMAPFHALGFLALAIVFLAGIQLAAMGVLGEYIGRIYREVREQPLFVVREQLDHPED